MGIEKAPSSKPSKVEAEPSAMTEARFLNEIGRLERGAGQIAAQWMNRYSEAAEADFTDLFSEFETFLKKRENALFSLEIPEGLDPKLVAEIKQFDQNVVLSFGSTTLFQGNGATAEVYEVAGYPQLCWKFVTNQARYNENNHIRVEFNLLNRMRGFEVGGVRTPTPYFLRIHPRDGHSYGMERVDGKNLSQLLEHPEQSPELIAIAKGMDREQVLKQLGDFVQAMHKEKGITHGDLFLRNIMLDRNGGIFVIDFGKAKFHEMDTHARDLTQELDLGTMDSEIRRFFATIDNINNVT